MSTKNEIDNILGNSEAIYQVKSVIRQVAPTDITVLITGESGTGKELVAKAIHSLSQRKKESLVSLNCGAIPEGIFESEIFGHEKGSFTSAERLRQGYFEMADKGTLFLDEIGEMPLQVQVKILRVLENGTFLRVGGSREIRVDVRVIAATNKNLEEEVNFGRFRQDLYYRLKAVNLSIPPLRDRTDDIPILVNIFAKVYGDRNDRPMPAFSPAVFDLLSRHYWSGNIRELKNLIESILALTQNDYIDIEDVRPRLEESRGSHNLPVLVNKPVDELDRELIYSTLLELRYELQSIRAFLQRLTIERREDTEIVFPNAEEVETYSLDEVEKEQIKRTLEDFRGNRRLAAQALGIGERTLYRKISQYGLR